MWAQGAATPRVKLPLKVPPPTEGSDFSQVATGRTDRISASPHQPRQTSGSRRSASETQYSRGDGEQGRTGRAAPFIIFRCFPQEHRRALRNPHIWIPFKLPEQIPSLASEGLGAPDVAGSVWPSRAGVGREMGA